MTGGFAMTVPIWSPSPQQVAQCQLAQFRKHLAAKKHAVGGSYAELHAWSVEHAPDFWTAIWDYCGVRGARGVRALQSGVDMRTAQWFPDALLNFAENLLDVSSAAPALIFRREDGERLEWSRAELLDQVARLRSGLERVGVQRGDRVVGFLPNLPEAVVGMLASASLGAIWSSCSPDFGVPGVVDRFGQIEPKVVIAADGYFYKGRAFDTRDKLREVLAQLPSVEATVLVPFTDAAARCEGTQPWNEFIAAEGASMQYEAVPFDHPLYVMYSSGTTGKPKCIVHGHGGTLLQHLKEHQLHTDIRPGEKLFYYTTTGWMMWNWLVSGLASGATLVLFDGNPFHPGPEALWQIVAEEAVEHFGTSAKFIDACKKAEYSPAAQLDLSSLRTILSTGSPLVPESFDWVYAEVKDDLLLASITGGTDIVSCFALGCPELPVWRGELQCAGLGMAVDIWDDEAQPLRGEAGELVCTQPFPSAPVGFWNDEDGARYSAAYFEYFPGIWRHGDWVARTEHDGFVVFGRSDATLNPGGVRIGTAEIYRQVEQIPAILESIVVGQDTGDGDQRVVLFVRLAEGLELSEALEAEVRTRVRAQATPRHVPSVIAAVQDIPRTRSGKISEIAVRDVLHGRTVKNTEALANPEALQEFLPQGKLALASQ